MRPARPTAAGLIRLLIRRSFCYNMFWRERLLGRPFLASALWYTSWYTSVWHNGWIRVNCRIVASPATKGGNDNAHNTGNHSKSRRHGHRYTCNSHVDLRHYPSWGASLLAFTVYQWAWVEPEGLAILGPTITVVVGMVWLGGKSFVKAVSK